MMMHMGKALATSLLIITISKLIKCDGDCEPGERLEQVIFSKKVEDRILEGFIASIKPVSTDMECQMLCILDGMCNSYNFGEQNSSFSHSCQVLRYGIGNDTVKLKKGWSFRARKCLSSPCLNGSTCFATDKSYTPRCACPHPWTALGMESGAIPDEKINASSEYNHTSHVARHARLRSTAGAWVAGISNGTNVSQWLQIDLGSQHQVSGVATQGKGADNQFVSSYNLQYSNDEVSFHFYKEQEEASNKEFAGNTDASTVVYQDVNPPIKARYIRFLPVAWSVGISLRVEIYGCSEH